MRARTRLYRYETVALAQSGRRLGDKEREELPKVQRWLWSLIFFGLLIPIRPAFSQGTLHRESDEQNPDGYNRKRAGNLPEAT